VPVKGVVEGLAGVGFMKGLYEIGPWEQIRNARSGTGNPPHSGTGNRDRCKYMNINRLAEILFYSSSVTGLFTLERRVALEPFLTFIPSLIRNLEKAFWFGTIRVLEENR
jgi:hypothetical protein